MSVVRSLSAFVLLLMAALSCLLGSVGQWVDQIANTDGKAADIVAPLAADPVVLGAIADELESAAHDRIPRTVESIPGLQGYLEQVLTRAVNAALARDGVDAAWRESLDRSRAGAVADLESYRVDQSETPTLWLDLTPFVDLAREELVAASDSRARPYLDRIAWGETVRVPLGRPDPMTANLASEGLGLARHWMIGFVAAAVLAAVGLAVGSRRGRWLALTLAAILGLVAVLAGRHFAGQVDLAGRQTGLRSAVMSSLGQGALRSLLDWTRSWPWAFIAVVCVGILGLWVATVRARRAARPGS